MIHKYKLNGYNIVLDVNSGAVHIVDDLAYDILDYLDETNIFFVLDEKAIKDLSEKYSISEINETCEELKNLYNEGG